MSLPKEKYENELEWALELGTREHVTFTNYVRRFHLHDRSHAEDTFQRLISSVRIATERRDNLQKLYNAFQAHHADLFWTTRTAQIKTTINAKRAATDSQEIGLKEARLENKKRFQRLKNQADEIENALDELFGTGENEESTRVPSGPKGSMLHSDHPLLPSEASHTPTYLGGSVSSSPDQSTLSPPPSLRSALRSVAMEDESNPFHLSSALKKESLFCSLDGGRSLPLWAKERPSYTFELRLKQDWGPQVTSLYEATKSKPLLDHNNVDEIALLSGILHFHKSHIGFSTMEMSDIRNEILQRFYSKDMEDNDMERAEYLVELWGGWMKKWKSIQLKEKLIAQRENRAPSDVSTEPIVDDIMASYTECKHKGVISFLFIALHVFRLFNNWTVLASESDCMMAVIAPILQEIMTIQHSVKFTCANAATSAGKARKVELEQEGQSRQPDIVGQTQDKQEVFYGELKGLHPTTAGVNTDLLRLAIFTKDSLDQLHNTLEQGPPLLTFQAKGCSVSFFLGAKVSNTIIHAHLSTITLPSRLNELDLDLEFFFSLLQVQTLLGVTKACLAKKREAPLQEIPFPTLGTPERNAALMTPKKLSRSQGSGKEGPS
ncbi:hypothetical protein BGX26_003866 [Mortierella sp. AD094]|nr:hypothetical protein BGX26_003866 [Mortierella sp. AD094]